MPRDDTELLAALEVYYDAAPRSAARAEPFGPFTLFVNDGPGWPYYARPTLGATTFAPVDVARVRERQRALNIPESLEWVAETTPGVGPAASAAGLAVHDHPLLVLAPAALPPVAMAAGATLRLVGAGDDLARVGAVAQVAFAAGGTALGTAGVEALAPVAAGRESAQIAFERARLAAGLTITAAAFIGGDPVAVGSHQPVGATSEIVGVGTLPAFRRQGLAAAVVALLAADAVERGARLVFLSAGNAAVARVYERLGFRRVATACIAEPPTG